MAKDDKAPEAKAADAAAKQAEKDAADIAAWQASAVGKYVMGRLDVLTHRTGGHPPSETSIGRMPG